MTTQQIAMETVATMLSEAKQLLMAAKEIADENNIGFCLEDLYEEVSGNYVDWNSSSC